MCWEDGGNISPVGRGIDQRSKSGTLILGVGSGMAGLPCRVSMFTKHAYPGCAGEGMAPSKKNARKTFHALA